MRSHRLYGKRRSLALLLLISLIATGCAKTPENNGKKTFLFGEQSSEYERIEAPAGFDWKQCDGTILNFICEDNINANILSKESEKFTEATGIVINIKRMDFNTLEEKINMEFISKTAQYDLIYVDPYKTLNRFYDGLEDLNRYEQDETLPHIVGGIDSFSEKHLEVCSYFGTKDKLYAIPFDSTTMILFYRKDIFKKYRKEMARELGFEPDPEGGAFTWDQFIAVSKWINENLDRFEIRYGSLTMSARHNSIYTAFSTVLGAYGGEYFANDKIVGLGTATGPELQSKTKEFQTALGKFKEIIALNPDKAQGFTWDEVANAYTKGEVAMMINWDENVSAVENSEMAGKTGFSVLPRGPVRSSNLYGGSGIGINSYANDRKKLAAWMFIVWATSPEVQMKSFTEKEGGTLPTRTDLTKLIAENYSGTAPQVTAMVRSQMPEYAYFRPKMKNGYDFEETMISNLYDMVQEDLDINSVSINMRSRWIELN